MKKLILLMTLALIWHLFGTCQAANVMETDSYSFNVISMADADNEAPYCTDFFPANGAVGMSINTKPSCHVKDKLMGVDIESIVMKVNGNIVPINVLGDKNDYFVEGNPGILPWNDIVYITIDCYDLSN